MKPYVNDHTTDTRAFRVLDASGPIPKNNLRLEYNDRGWEVVVDDLLTCGCPVETVVLGLNQELRERLQCG